MSVSYCRDELIVSASQPDSKIDSATVLDKVSVKVDGLTSVVQSFSQPIKPEHLFLGSQLPVTQCFSQVILLYISFPLSVFL